MTAGTIHVMSSASQAAASVITAGAQTIQSGFLAVLSALSPSASGNASAAASTITITAAAGQVTLSIPAGAFASNVVVTLSAPASFPAAAAAAASLTGTGVGVQITLDQAVQPAANATLTITYRPSDVAGLDPTTLILARYDAVQDVWVPLVSSVDTLTGTVTAQTNHFSLFQIMAAAPSGSVSTAKAFPNPLRPAQGQAFMTFSNLPASARIRIYNLKGVTIKDLTANASGMANWDATNQSGAPVASGVYFVFAQGAGASRTFEVAVQR